MKRLLKKISCVLISVTILILILAETLIAWKKQRRILCIPSIFRYARPLLFFEMPSPPLCNKPRKGQTGTQISDLIDDIDDQSSAELNIAITGDPISIWASIDSLHKCHQIDVPDIPTRAYTVPNNNSSTAIIGTTIHMIQGSTNFHIMTGPSLFNISRQCHANWNKTANPDPAKYAANEFLDSPVAFPNGTVVALAHTEYPGNRYDNCPGHAYPYCWTVSIGLMISRDYGTTWHHIRPPPHHLVAAVPYRYNTTQLASGWGDPTNILRNPNDDYYYVALWNRNMVGLQPAGVCMMRTHTSQLLDPTSWRAWNGSHYDVSLSVSPYLSNIDPKNHICTVLSIDASILDPTQCNPYGLVWSVPLQLFIMTWACLNGPIYITNSKDLLHWSTPRAFYDKSMLPRATSEKVTGIHYPNLMDASAPALWNDSNYGIVGENPHLFWVSHGHNPYLDGRSAYATQLHISKKKKEILEKKTK